MSRRPHPRKVRQRRNTRRQLRHRRMRIEKLQSRELMAADAGAFLAVDLDADANYGASSIASIQATQPQVTASKGKLQIVGSDQGDRVRITRDQQQRVVVEADLGGRSTVQTFAHVKSIDFRGRGGDDVFINDTDVRVKARGDAGNDVLTGGSGKDRLDGGDGDDLLIGRGGKDKLKGGSGNDTLDGGDGPDKLNGGKGDDKLYGGPDKDTLKDKHGDNKLEQDGSLQRPVQLDVSTGVLSIAGGEAADRAVVEQSVDGRTVTVTLEGGDVSVAETFSRTAIKEIVFRGGRNHDTFLNRTDIKSRAFGDDGRDYLLGGSNNDSLYGGDGDDVLVGGPGNDRLEGGRDNDSYSFSSGHQGNDTIGDLHGIDTLDFSGMSARIDVDLDGGIQGMRSTVGNLNLDARGIIENAIGTRYNDVIHGSWKDNVLQGGAGHDVLNGRTGDDTLLGESGNDELRGQGGNDRLDGGRDNDIYRYFGGFQGTDTVSDPHGTDTLDFSGMWARVDVDLDGGIQGMRSTWGSVSLDTGRIIENVYGTRFNDVIHGSSKNNLLTGGAGDDVLNGRGGDDTLHGEGGNDELRGWDGNDHLYGGPDNDVYRYFSGPQGHDRIEDSGGTDTLDFSGMSTRVDVDLDGGIQGMRSTLGSNYIVERGSVENVYGTPYHDVIHGSAKDNFLYGGAGDDVLNGRSGNDRLYGADGADWIRGREGNDSIFGGIDNSVDTLDLDAGADYILNWGAGIDVIRNYSRSEDAIVTFQNGRDLDDAGRGWWTENDIALIDDVFRQLVEETGNTNLLRRHDGFNNPANGYWDPRMLVFRRHTQAGDIADANSSTSVVRVFDATFDENEDGRTMHDSRNLRRDRETRWARQTIFHELAHFRDQPSEWSGAQTFRNLTGWHQATRRPQGYVASGQDVDIATDPSHPRHDPNHLTDTSKVKWYHYAEVRQDWARDYSKHSPNEDFATSFAAYFMRKDYISGSSEGYTADWIDPSKSVTAIGKMAHIQKLVNDLS